MSEGASNDAAGTDDAQHRGGGEGGVAVLHAGVAEGDASQRIAQPLGDGVPPTGASGEQVPPVLNSGAALQDSGWGGPLSHLAPQQLTAMGAAWQMQ